MFVMQRADLPRGETLPDDPSELVWVDILTHKTWELAQAHAAMIIEEYTESDFTYRVTIVDDALLAVMFNSGDVQIFRVGTRDETYH